MIRLLVVLVPGVLAAAGFTALAEQVSSEHARRRVGAFDTRVALAIHRIDSKPSDIVMRATTELGSAPMIFAVSTFATILAARAGHRRTAVVIVAVALAASIATWLLKLAFARERPSLFRELPPLDSFSFPSAHALMSAAVYGMVAVAVVRLRPALRRPVTAATLFLIAAIGVSRIYLGVHWPTDVLAGFSGGILLVIAGWLALGAPLSRRGIARDTPADS